MFDPSDPFPLIAGKGISYPDEKLHAAHVDKWLGFQTEAVETKLAQSDIANEQDREFWLGKSVQTFSTPYTELRSIIEDLRPVLADQNAPTIVDLGAGYGRLAHVMDAHIPHVRFIGYELVRERQAEGQRVIEQRRLKLAELIYQDVTTLDFETLTASVFFLYDFGSREDVETCMEILKRLARRTTITVVGRGGRSREVIEKLHPWLSQVVKPLHRDHHSVYSSGEKSVENS